MTPLRCALFLAVLLTAAGCGVRDATPPSDDAQTRSPQPGSGPTFRINGNAQFFSGGTWTR